MNKGRIRISRQLYEHDYDMISGIFEAVRPIKIDYEYWSSQSYVVWGVSDEFDKVEEGCEIPFYDATYDVSLAFWEFKKL